MLNNVLFIILGAGLASVGFLAAALADRLRSPHASREVVPRTWPSHTRGEAAIPVIEAAELLPPTRPTRSRAPQAKPTVITSAEGGSDVIAALVAAGYKRPVAAEATWACELAERATIEGWTAAALRRCARGWAS